MKHLTNKAVVSSFFEVYNTKDYDALHSCMSPTYIDHTLPNVRSLQEAIEILKSTHQAFPDIRVIIDDLIEENSLVTFRGRFQGTHLGEFLDLPPSGARVEFEALEIFKLQDQLITESWGYWPLPTILDQIKESLG